MLRIDYDTIASENKISPPGYKPYVPMERDSTQLSHRKCNSANKEKRNNSPSSRNVSQIRGQHQLDTLKNERVLSIISQKKSRSKQIGIDIFSVWNKILLIFLLFIYI